MPAKTRLFPCVTARRRRKTCTRARPLRSFGQGIKRSLPTTLPAWRRPLPFVWESTGVETHFTNRLDPEPRARSVFAFFQLELLAQWLAFVAAPTVGNAANEEPGTFLARMRAMPPLVTEWGSGGAHYQLWPAQIKAITRLEESLAANKPKALIQMATGSGKTFTAISFIYRLIRFAGVRRVLFLVDRGNLGRQTKKEFDAYVSPYNNYKFGEEYIVHFRTRASGPRKVDFGISQAKDPWQNLGLFGTLDVAQEWVEVERRFRASMSDAARAGIDFAKARTFWSFQPPRRLVQGLRARIDAEGPTGDHGESAGDQTRGDLARPIDAVCRGRPRAHHGHTAAGHRREIDRSAHPEAQRRHGEIVQADRPFPVIGSEDAGTQPLGDPDVVRHPLDTAQPVEAGPQNLRECSGPPLDEPGDQGGRGGNQRDTQPVVQAVSAAKAALLGAKIGGRGNHFVAHFGRRFPALLRAPGG